MVRVGDEDIIVASAITRGESKFLKALDIETPYPNELINSVFLFNKANA